MQLVSRRRALALGAGITACLTVRDVMPAFATPSESAAEIAKFTGGRTPNKGSIVIDLPEIAENGNTIPLQVTLDSPMTADNYVTDMLVVADGNPRPGVARFHFTPLSGKATAATRIRLQATQDIIVVARTSDDKFIMDRKEVQVTMGGCAG